MQRIVQHLGGAPGRTNLVWLAQQSRLAPSILSLLPQANIVLYPVAVRGFGSAQEQGSAAGGRQFFDATDLMFAVRAAEEGPHHSRPKPL